MQQRAHLQCKSLAVHGFHARQPRIRATRVPQTTVRPPCEADALCSTAVVRAGRLYHDGLHGLHGLFGRRHGPLELGGRVFPTIALQGMAMELLIVLSEAC